MISEKSYKLKSFRGARVYPKSQKIAHAPEFFILSALKSVVEDIKTICEISSMLLIKLRKRCNVYSADIEQISNILIPSSFDLDVPVGDALLATRTNEQINLS